MKKNAEKRQRFGFRKLKVGLASVAVSLFFLGSYQAQANETTAEAEIGKTIVDETLLEELNKQPVSTIETSDAGTATIEGASAAEVATDNITATLTQPTVPADQAVEGDVLDVTVDTVDGPVTETVDGNIATATASGTVTVTTTSIAAKTEPVGKQDPVVTTWTSEVTYEEDGTKIAQKERVVKTTTVEVVKEADIITKASGTADIVFVIDHTGSMGIQIEAVKTNVTNFVSKLQNSNVNVRLGLADYESATNTNYTSFGNSKFTNDTTSFISALTAISLTGGLEEPTAALAHIADSANYDWSTQANAKRFVVLITDEDMDFFSTNVPTYQEAVAKLNKMDIKTTVITLSTLNSTYQPLTTDTGGLLIDINSDFAKTLESDIANWVVDTVQEGRLIKTTEDKYELFVEVVLETPEVPETPTPKPTPKAVKTPNCPDEKPMAVAKAAALPVTGEAESKAIAAIGSVMLVASLGMGVVAKKKSNN